MLRYPLPNVDLIMVRMTQEEVMAHEMRVNPVAHSKSPSDAVERESKLHTDIIDWCNSQFPRWKFRHARLDRKTTEPLGIEDFTIFASDNRTFHFECKARGKKRTTEQLAWSFEMGRLGHVVHLVESMSQFLAVINSGDASQRRD